MVKYLADTYALIEFLRGNEKYRGYLKEGRFAVTKLNLMELYYFALREESQEKADAYYDAFLNFAVEPPDESIKKAMKLKLEMKERKLSYADAVGYQTARDLGMKFLTGDKEFEALEGVEFVV
jgi:predicted nucleic acid-binding protein